MRSHGGLVTPYAADPRLYIFQRLLHRLDFMQVTAQVRVFDRERAGVLSGEHIPAMIAVQVDDVQLPFRGDPLAKDERLPEMIAGIQKENGHVPVDGCHHVQQRHRLCLKG